MIVEKKRIAIFGSTGSIGERALNIISKYPDQFDLILITNLTSFKKLILKIPQFFSLIFFI